ncbi:MAG: hypothetical protein A2606_02070 [Candidatus Yanofskybacteria bacterium RIFOXYD1_FULL_42_10]|uniref:Uncharacterized protein n=3 Tax=Parcubacteria group TaxID=1794811 RepID=A0A1F8HUR6_9BACT|nr:MAG: hypothetical protein A2606_02070 [Candidatus Yanofskybacteria bacterium RIFOXYD1_FULL_42_10]
MKMGETIHKQFTNTVMALSRVLYLLKDKFLARKLYQKLNDFTAGYIKFSVSKNMDGKSEQEICVAQSTAGEELLTEINSLLELSEYLEHYSAINHIPLLLVRKSLLFVKLDLIKFTKTIKTTGTGVLEIKKETLSKNLIKNASAEEYSNNEDNDLSVNKEKIIHFIKKFPNARTKDIIEEFSVLSARTVKRNLSELAQSGLLRKSIKSKAVYYSVI